MSHIKNVSIGVGNKAIISGSTVEVTGSLYGSAMSGTTAEFTSLSASSVRINNAYTLPTSDGTTGQVISTNGSGELTFSSVSAGSSPGGPDTSVQFNSGSSLSGSSNLTYDYTTGVLSGTLSSFTQVSASHITLSSSTEPTQTAGTIFYDNTNNLLRQWTEVTNVDLHLGQQLAVRVKNDSGVTLAKGKVVHLTGSTSSDTPLVTTASYESDSLSADTLGVLMSELDANEVGYALLYGVLTGINLSTYSSGDLLYLSSSGDFSNSVPQSPFHEVRIAQVTRATSNGAMFVRIQNGYETDELHDVLFSSKAEGDLISWDNTTGVWRNTKNLTGSYNISGTLSFPDIEGDTAIRVAGGSSTDTTLLRVDATNQGSSDSANYGFSLKYMGSRDGNFNSLSVFSDNQTGTAVEAMTILQDGKVGIGSTTPEYPLHIVGTGSVQALIQNTSTAAGSDATLVFNRSGQSIAMGIDQSDNSFRIADNNSLGTNDRFAITTGGYIGIGTTSPSRKLEVNGTLLAQTELATGLSPNGAIYMRHLNGSSANDAVDLHIRPSSGKSGYITFTENGVADRWGIGISGSSGDLKFFAGSPLTGTERLTIQSGGNVGIGTNTPEHTLSVTGTLGVSGNTTLSTLTASNADFTNITADTITAREYHTELVSASIIYQSGSTKFGDDANDIHQFSGSIRQSGSTLANYFLGSLAVGDSNPASYKLYVNGTSKIGGNLLSFGPSTGDATIQGNTTDSLIINAKSFMVLNYDSDNDEGSSALYIGRNSTTDAGTKDVAVTEGSVGIGSTTPNSYSTGARRLVIADTSGDTGITIHSNTANQGRIYFGDGVSTGTTSREGQIVYDHSTDAMAFSTVHAERVRINSSGNVGMGTTSPSARLHVETSVAGITTILGRGLDSNFILNTSQSLNNNSGDVLMEMGLRYGTSTNKNSAIRFHRGGGSVGGFLSFTSNNDSERMRIDALGNVGIGTTSPTTKLEISTAVNSTGLTISQPTTTGFNTGDGMKIRFYDPRSGGSVLSTIRTHYNGDGTHRLSLGSDSTEEEVVIRNGNVGIGTNAPSSLLHLKSTGDAGIILEADSDNVTEDDNPFVAFAQDGSNISAGGVIGLVGTAGTEPANGNSFTDSLANYFLLGNKNTTSGIQLGSNSSVGMTIDASNNIGIGTTSPGANLDVSGSTIFGRLSSDTHEFSGSVNVSGTLTATAKSFDIPHPTKDGMRLRYGSLEGAENGVYVRGMTTGSVIELPEHWTGLVDEETITVNLTPYGTSQQLWVKKIEDNKVYIGGKLNKCFFTVFGERKDIDKLVVEY